MPASAVALQIFLILLPGFAAAYLVQLIVIRAKQTDLDKIIEALLFSFVIYVTNAAVHPRSVPVYFVHTPQGDSIDFHPRDPLWLAGLTFGYAVLMILYVQFDGARVLRWMKLTERTSRSSIWNDTFQDIQQDIVPALGTIVQVELKDGRSVMGIVSFYSDTAEECSVFLRNAEWIDVERDARIPIDGPGILLTRNAEITSVSFLNPN